MDKNDLHYLYPGALHVSKEPIFITTVLGSCVSICLWDPILKYGGMNHFMLPFWNGKGLASPKYGNIAVEKLVEKMLDLGCKKVNLKAKVFGGGDVINNDSNMFHIGERNIELAKDMLLDLSIPILSSSLGGRNGRKIIFQTDNGVVNHKLIQNSLRNDEK
ncbi:MAG: chemotaxis protein CheD [Bacteroidetes bacterium GWA2_31_9]|nr:MAG: chemotaxis protein CheD [Bacteroidetes bacterium GWA2_31_9]